MDTANPILVENGKTLKRSVSISIPGPIDNTLAHWLALKSAPGTTVTKGSVVTEMVSMLTEIGWEPGRKVRLVVAKNGGPLTTARPPST